MIPSQSDVERAFRDVLRWIGEDPDSDGLRETPNRMARAFQEYFSGISKTRSRFFERLSKKQTAMMKW